jgi:hypothetical protein
MLLSTLMSEGECTMRIILDVRTRFKVHLIQSFESTPKYTKPENKAAKQSSVFSIETHIAGVKAITPEITKSLRLHVEASRYAFTNDAIAKTTARLPTKRSQ